MNENFFGNWNDVFHFIQSSLFLSARILPVFIILPVFSRSIFSGLLLVGVMLIFGVFVYPSFPDLLEQQDIKNFPLTITILIKEVLFGVFIAFVISIPFWMFEFIGVLIDSQRGALIGGQFNPFHSRNELTIGVLHTTFLGNILYK